jgi:hypothetical protein
MIAIDDPSPLVGKPAQPVDREDLPEAPVSRRRNVTFFDRSAGGRPNLVSEIQ